MKRVLKVFMCFAVMFSMNITSVLATNSISKDSEGKVTCIRLDKVKVKENDKVSDVESKLLASTDSIEEIDCYCSWVGQGFGEYLYLHDGSIQLEKGKKYKAELDIILPGGLNKDVEIYIDGKKALPGVDANGNPYDHQSLINGQPYYAIYTYEDQCDAINIRYVFDVEPLKDENDVPKSNTTASNPQSIQTNSNQSSLKTETDQPKTNPTVSKTTSKQTTSTNTKSNIVEAATDEKTNKEITNNDVVTPTSKDSKDENKGIDTKISNTKSKEVKKTSSFKVDALLLTSLSIVAGIVIFIVFKR